MMFTYKQHKEKNEIFENAMCHTHFHTCAVECMHSPQTFTLENTSSPNSEKERQNQSSDGCCLQVFLSSVSSRQTSNTKPNRGTNKHNSPLNHHTHSTPHLPPSHRHPHSPPHQNVIANSYGVHAQSWWSLTDEQLAGAERV